MSYKLNCIYRKFGQQGSPIVGMVVTISPSFSL